MSVSGVCNRLLCRLKTALRCLSLSSLNDVNGFLKGKFVNKDTELLTILILDFFIFFYDNLCVEQPRFACDFY